MKKRLKTAIMLLASMGITLVTSNSTVVKADENTIQWKIQTPTAMHETDCNWEFVVGDYNGDGIQDLYCILKSGTSGSGHVEVHVLNGANNFQSYIAQMITPLSLDDRWTFQLGDLNKDGKADLYSVLRSADSNKKTEVHILNGANNFGNFIMQMQLPLYQTYKGWEFRTADGDHDGIPDLYGIQTKDTSTNKVEIHALSGRSNYTAMVMEYATALGAGSDNWQFGISDFDGDNDPDLYCIKESLTGSKKTEVHVLSYASGFKNFIFQSPTLLHEVSRDGFDVIMGPGRLDLWAIEKSGTFSKTTEVHRQGYIENINKVEPLDQKRQAVVNEAKKYLNIPYVWGGTTPAGFDCSGLTQYVYNHALGIDITRTTYTQVEQGIPVSVSDLKPGDLIFPNAHHVQLYIGNGQVLHAPHTGDVVRIADLGSVWKARRIIY